jgi:hypothetical protein
VTNHARLLREASPYPVIGRGRASLTFDAGGGRKQTILTLDPLHIQGTEIEIDTAWQSTMGAWQYQMVLADYNAYARNVLNAGDAIQYVDPGSGQSVTFQPLALNWVNADNSRQQLAQPQAVPALVEDDTLRWPGGYGPGRHFQWRADSRKLEKLLILDSPAALPAPAAWLGTGELWLELEFILKLSAGVDPYLDGVRWARTTARVRTAGRIEFRSTSSGAVLWYLDYPAAYDSAGERVIGQFELRRQGGSYYITVRVPRAWVEAAAYPIAIDPTLDIQPDGTGGKDTGIRSDNPTTNYGTVESFPVGRDGSNYVRILLEHDLSSIPAGATCISATEYLTTTYQDFYPSFARPVSLYELRAGRAGWTEAGATWNTYDGANAWTAAGCADTSADRQAAAVGTGTTNGSNPGGTFALTLDPAAVAGWFGDSNANYGLLLRGDNETQTGWKSAIALSDHATAANRPRLVVEWEESGGGSVTGSLAATLQAATAAATATAAVRGTLTASLQAATLTASGTTAVRGQLTATLAALTLEAAGTVVNGLTGTLNAALAPLTAEAAGKVGVSGALDAELAPLTATTSGQVVIKATLIATLAPVTLAAQGFVGDVPVQGTLAATLAPATVEASAAVRVQGQAAVTLAPLTASGTGIVPVVGALEAALAPLTLAAPGAVQVRGALAVALTALTLAATGHVYAGGVQIVAIRTRLRTHGMQVGLRRGSIGFRHRQYPIDFDQEDEP